MKRLISNAKSRTKALKEGVRKKLRAKVKGAVSPEVGDAVREKLDRVRTVAKRLAGQVRARAASK
ncbi:MAG TPA: hypothetical protein VN719_03740 [Gemmatimonadales bacterium]|nr:hypothetical protein [Gemmatimonadales bacterium]